MFCVPTRSPTLFASITKWTRRSPTWRGTSESWRRYGIPLGAGAVIIHGCTTVGGGATNVGGTAGSGGTSTSAALIRSTGSVGVTGVTCDTRGVPGRGGGGGLSRGCSSVTGSGGAGGAARKGPTAHKQPLGCEAGA